jgi:hypothetical protein
MSKATKRKAASDLKEGLFWKKVKVAPRLKLSDAIAQRNRRDDNGFVEGDATLRIVGMPERYTVDRCPEFFVDRQKRPCYQQVVS